MFYSDILGVNTVQEALDVVKHQYDLLSRGLFYHLTGNKSKAIHYYLRDATADSFYCLAYLHEDNPDKFIKYLNKSITLGGPYLSLLGDYHQYLSDYDSAIASYKRGMDDPKCVYKLAVLCDNESSPALYELGVGMKDTDCMINLANIWVKTEDKYKEAITLYNRALETNNRTYWHLGKAFTIKKQYQKAIIAWEAGADFAQLDCVLELARYYALKYDYDKSSRRYFQAVEMGHSEYYFELGETLILMKRYFEGVKAHKKGAKTDSRNCLALAEYYETVEENVPETLKWYQQGVSMNDRHCIYNLGLYYENSKDYSEAFKYYLLSHKHGHLAALNTLMEFYTTLKEDFLDYLYEITEILQLKDLPLEFKQNVVNDMLEEDVYRYFITHLTRERETIYNEECPVCYEIINDESTVLSCGHGYCQACLIIMCENYTTCAVCKQVIC